MEFQIPQQRLQQHLIHTMQRRQACDLSKQKILENQSTWGFRLWKFQESGQVGEKLHTNAEVSNTRNQSRVCGKSTKTEKEENNIATNVQKRQITATPLKKKYTRRKSETFFHLSTTNITIALNLQQQHRHHRSQDRDQASSPKLVTQQTYHQC